MMTPPIVVKSFRESKYSINRITAEVDLGAGNQDLATQSNDKFRVGTCPANRKDIFSDFCYVTACSFWHTETV